VTASIPDGVLITGVYGSGKSSVAAEIAFVLEDRGEPFALLDLDFLGWGGVPGWPPNRSRPVRASVWRSWSSVMTSRSRRSPSRS